MYPGNFQTGYNAEANMVPAPYRPENVKDIARIDPEYGIANNYEFHTKKNNVIPMREVFLNVGKMIESFKDAKFSLNEALTKVMDDISKDSMITYRKIYRDFVKFKF